MKSTSHKSLREFRQCSVRIIAPLTAFFSFPGAAMAQQQQQAQTRNPLTGNPLLNTAAGNAGYNTSPSDTLFFELLGRIIFALVSFLGILFVLLIVYGGYVWMNARGNEEEVKKAKRIIRDAIFGLMVLGASFSVWVFIENLIF